MDIISHENSMSPSVIEFRKVGRDPASRKCCMHMCTLLCVCVCWEFVMGDLHDAKVRGLNSLVQRLQVRAAVCASAAMRAVGFRKLICSMLFQTLGL